MTFKVLLVVVPFLLSSHSLAKEICTITAFHHNNSIVGSSGFKVDFLSSASGREAKFDRWEECYEHAMSLANKYSNLWDDSSKRYDVFDDPHVYFCWEFNNGFFDDSDGCVNKHSVPDRNGFYQTGSQVRDVSGKLIDLGW